MDTFNKTQVTLIQAMTRLENQFSQQTNTISERPKGTLPNQPLSNPINFRQANEAQDPNQCNLVHTLRSKKQVDNQVSTPSNPTQASTSSSPTPPNSERKDKSVKQVYKPIAPFLNSLGITIMHTWRKYLSCLVK